MAGQRLGRRMKARGQIGQITRAGRTVSLAGEAHHRLGRIAGQVLPGPIDPDELERGVEPENRLACQLPELIRLEWGKTWRPHRNQRSIQEKPSRNAGSLTKGNRSTWRPAITEARFASGSLAD